MRRTATISILGLILAVVMGAASFSNAALPPVPCDQGGPCSCGALYNLDRCSGIGNNTCGCGSGFTGPSLGPTSDCSVSFPSNSCCLPTGQTYASACLGRVDGDACVSNSQCTSGACVGGFCAAGAARTTPAPVLSGVSQILLVAAALLGHAWWSRRTRFRQLRN